MKAAEYEYDPADFLNVLGHLMICSSNDLGEKFGCHLRLSFSSAIVQCMAPHPHGLLPHSACCVKGLQKHIRTLCGGVAELNAHLCGL